ncbi:cytochrome P450 [Actinomadura harenae]|uniref:Cytochrome P450 n=1 Tax=Actinomadura harenae TaxID=2483351 RepID=A0A3M2MEZ9_9ACTN|nr:cytochrome P450 [Actinomadura harenae]RMI47195.1 cytochrome P450 [Actinomadura harenae]
MRGDRTLDRIPGPPPKDGAEAIAAAGGLHNYQRKLHAEHGPVVRLALPGGDVAVSVADPVLLEATAGIDKRPDELFAFLEPLQEAGNLQTLPADEHTPWRRVLLTVLAGRPSHEAHFARFTELTVDLADRWERQGSVELQKDLSELSLRMICAYALGGGLSPERSAHVVSAFEDVLTEHQAQPRAALAYLRGTVDDVLAAPERGDLVAALAEAGMSPARIRDSVLMIMLAAHHTTGVAISWTLYLLSRHPSAADRATAEVDAVLAGRAVPDYADLRRMTYLDRVLKEAMRLYPPGPYGARETTEEVTLGEYTVPPGTTIFYPFWAVHMNPECWPEPERFDPDRFTPEASAGRPRLAHIPFGFGPRSCEGAALAMVEARLVLAVLLKRLRFRLTPGQTITPIERFVLWAQNDIRMDVTPRSG